MTEYYRIELSNATWPSIPATLMKFNELIGEHIRSGMEPNQEGTLIHKAVLRLADGRTVHVPFANLRKALPSEVNEYITEQLIHV